MKTGTHKYLWPYLAQFFVEWEMFQKSVIEKIKTNITCFKPIFFSKNCAVYDNVGKKWLQQPRLDLYPEPHKSSTHPLTLFLSDPFQYYIPTHP